MPQRISARPSAWRSRGLSSAASKILDDLGEMPLASEAVVIV